MSSGDGLDKITLEVLRNSLSSLVDEMGITLSRAALSLVITFGKDFSGAVLTKDGDLVKQGVIDPAKVVWDGAARCGFCCGSPGRDKASSCNSVALR